MSRPMLSSAGSALHRALMTMVENEQSRFLLTSWLSVDWQSLTFVGERHMASFAVRGEQALELAEKLVAGLEEAELPLGGGRFVADLKVIHCAPARDGDVVIELEALTLCE
ncbi:MULTISPECIES: hypothetical protein [Sphingomonas]|uniref:hypothetical protein n=1 Tax=Sphingomonas TaxID=13687 RepID=UPI00126A7133|nr:MULTISPECIES: hypothetical protein [Sphingomonas]